MMYLFMLIDVLLHSTTEFPHLSIQSTNPTVIQSHLKKLFAGIHQVKFVDDGQLKTIVAVKSLEGETVQLGSPVIVTNNVEVSRSENV